MASNQVGSGREASIQHVEVPPAAQPTIFRLHEFLQVVFLELGCLESQYAGTSVKGGRKIRAVTESCARDAIT